MANRTFYHSRHYYRRHTSSFASIRDLFRLELEEIQKAGKWKPERVITTPQAASIRVQESPRNILNFCANNYLGLSCHPEVITSAQDAVKKYGTGLSSVRCVSGTQDIHLELEKKIANFHDREDAILYTSCFDANAGLFAALFTANDALFSEELNHASIIDGIRLCRAKKYIYAHTDMEELESLLKSSNARVKVIVTDGVFSIKGTVAPLHKISFLALKYNALIVLDDSHATGVLGQTGRGTEEYLGLSRKVDIINSTLGKAVGGSLGGYTTGPKEIISLLRQCSRPYLFSNSLPPSVVAGSIKALDLLMGGSDLIEKLTNNTRQFRTGMKELGFTIKGEDHPIVPVVLETKRQAIEFTEDLFKEGIHVYAIRETPKGDPGEGQIRVQISAVHGPEDINKCLEAFKHIGRKWGVIQ